MNSERHSLLIFTLLTLTVLFLGLWAVSSDTQAQSIAPVNSNTQEDLRIQSLRLIEKSQLGRQLIERAKVLWKVNSTQGVLIDAQAEQAFLEKIVWGPVSRTDAVITRYFDPKTGNEQKEREVLIYLNRSLQLNELVLDLSHEMTHAVFQVMASKSGSGYSKRSVASPSAESSVDPYDPELTPERYVRNAIEGPGGEADAVFSECTVGLELYLNFKLDTHRCTKYLSRPLDLAGRGSLQTYFTRVGERVMAPSVPGFVRAKIVTDFYRVGGAFEKLKSQLPRLPLSAEEPKLFSSTGKAPYPASLLEEYLQLTEIACENTRKRIQLQGETPQATAMLEKRCRL